MKVLNNNEMRQVYGGGKLRDAVVAVGDALQSAYDWCKEHLHIDIEIGRR